MSASPSAARPPGDSHGEAPEVATAVNVVGTEVVFTAVLERLNRDAGLALIEQLGQEIDAHCRALVAARVAEEFAARERVWRRRWLVLMLVVLLLAAALSVLGYRDWRAAGG